MNRGREGVQWGGEVAMFSRVLRVITTRDLKKGLGGCGHWEENVPGREESQCRPRR